jgi:hypothetical protein
MFACLLRYEVDVERVGLKASGTVAAVVASASLVRVVPVAVVVGVAGVEVVGRKRVLEIGVVVGVVVGLVGESEGHGGRVVGQE